VGSGAHSCILATAGDAVQLAFDTVVVEKACSGQDNPPGSLKHAFSEMRQAGATVL
jgi:nicotinamidase-related amidase